MDLTSLAGTRVVVAGASGFIGWPTVNALRATACDVDGLDRAAIHSILSSGSLGHACDVLVWAAGRREQTLEMNRASHVELPCALARALDAKHVIYLSSGEVYGDISLPYAESDEPRGSSDYALAKLEGERAVSTLTSATVLRLGAVYGPGQTGPMLLARLPKMLRDNQRIPLTQGQHTRDFVFVDDVAEAIVRATESRATGIFNIATGRETQIRELCIKLADALGKDRSLLGFGDIQPRAGEALRYVLDVAKARDVLSWTARTSLDDGLSKL